MRNLKKLIIPILLIGIISIPSIVYGRAVKIKYRSYGSIEKFTAHLKEKEKLIDEAEKIVPGVKAKWQEVINERKILRKELEDIKDSKKEEKEDKREKKKEEIEKIRDKIKSGEITEEEAKKLMEEQRDDFKKSHGDEMDTTKEIREKYKQDWQAFAEAVNKKDANNIKITFDKVLNNMKSRNEALKKRIAKLNSN